MYGVPADLRLDFLHGAELIQVCLGQFELQVRFHPPACISVAGEWELADEAGNLIDRGLGDDPEKTSKFHRLLGCRVISSEVQPPESFALRFDTGLVLRVFDSSTEYESFSVQPGNIFV